MRKSHVLKALELPIALVAGFIMVLIVNAYSKTMIHEIKCAQGKQSIYTNVAE